MSRDRNCARCGSYFRAPYLKSTKMYCGSECQLRASKNKRHGYAGTKIHATWLDMRYRCRNPKFHNYARYGGRGIKVCERWDVFENFLADMGEHPGGEYTIERLDNDGNYEPGNCKWGTKLEQSRNRDIAYTPEEDQKIRDGAAAGLTYRQIAEVVGRPEKSVTARAKRIRVRLGRAHLPAHYARKRLLSQHTPQESRRDA